MEQPAGAREGKPPEGQAPAHALRSRKTHKDAGKTRGRGAGQRGLEQELGGSLFVWDTQVPAPGSDEAGGEGGGGGWLPAGPRGADARGGRGGGKSKKHSGKS